MVIVGHSSNPINTTRSDLAGAGIQTAGLAFGGYTSTGYTGATEEYDGTSWTSTSTSLNTARNLLRGCRHSNICFSFWWRFQVQLIQQQPKNGLVQEHQQQKQ
jgi:hypothetical protein